MPIDINDYITTEDTSNDPFSFMDSFNTPEDSSWEFRPVDRLKASIDQTVGALYGLGGVVSSAVGHDKGRDFFIQKAQEKFQEVADYGLQTVDFKDIREAEGFFDTTENVLKFGAESLVSYLPDFALMFLGGVGAGAGAAKAASTATGKKVAEKLVRRSINKNVQDLTKKYAGSRTVAEINKEALNLAVKEIGSLVGMATYEGSLGAGQAYLTDVETRGADEASPLAAAGTGIAQAGVTVLNPLNKFLASKTAGKVITSRGARAFGEMTLGEATEEMAQESISVLHEAGINPNLTVGEAFKDQEVWDRLATAGLAGAMIGGVFGSGRLMLEKNDPINNPDKVLEQAGIAVEEVEKTPIDPEVSDFMDNAYRYSMVKWRKDNNQDLTREEEMFLERYEAEKTWEAGPTEAPQGARRFLGTATTPEMIQEPTISEGMQVGGFELESREYLKKNLDRLFPDEVTKKEYTPAKEDVDAFLSDYRIYREEGGSYFVPEDVVRGMFEWERQTINALQRNKEAIKNVDPELTEFIQSLYDNTQRKLPIKEREAAIREFEREYNNFREKVVSSPILTTNIPEIQESKEVIQHMLDVEEYRKGILQKIQDKKVEKTPGETVKKEQEPTITPETAATMVRGQAYDEAGAIVETAPSAEDALIMTEEGVKEEGVMERSQEEVLTEAASRIPDPLVQALMKGDQTAITQEIEKYKVDDRKKALDDALRIAAPTAEVYGLTDYLVESHQIAHDTNTKRKGARKTALDWKDEGGGIVSAKAGDSTYLVVTEGKNKHRYYKDGEELGVAKSSMEARGAIEETIAVPQADTTPQKRRKKVKDPKDVEKLNVLKEAAESFALPKLTGSAVVDRLTTSKDPVISGLSRAIKRIVSGDKLDSINVTSTEGGDFYKHKQNTVNVKSLGNERVILHEIIHSITSREIEQNKKVRKDLQEVYTKVQEHLNNKGEVSEEIGYAMKNLREFMAVGMTSKEMQSILQEIPLENPKGLIKTLWDQFVSIIKNALGLANTQQSQLNKLINSFIEATQTEVEEGAVQDIVDEFAIGEEGASTKEKSFLNIAKKLEEAGKSKEDILKTTGWVKREDGEWRFLLSTTDVSLNQDTMDEVRMMRDTGEITDNVDEGVIYPLSDFISTDSQVMKKYKDIWDTVDVLVYNDLFSNTNGFVGYGADTGAPYIALNIAKPEPLETLVHEMQHVIQIVEGFAQGGSINAILDIHRQLQMSVLERVLKEEDQKDFLNMFNAFKERATMAAEELSKQGALDNKELFIANSVIESMFKLRETDEELDTWLSFQVPHLEELETAAKLFRKSKEIDNEQEKAEYKARSTEMLYPFYHALLGEVEAREAASDLYKTQEELRMIVPEDQVIDLAYSNVREESGIPFADEVSTMPVIVIKNSPDGNSVVSASLDPVMSDTVYRSKEDGKYYWAKEDGTQQEISKTVYDVKAKQFKEKAEKEAFKAYQKKEKPFTEVKRFGNEVASAFKNIAESVSGRLNRISPQVAELMRRIEMSIHRDQRKIKGQIKDWIKAYKKMSPEDKFKYDLAWYNQKMETLKEIHSRYPGMQASFDKMKKAAITKLQDRFYNTGMIVEKYEDYLPRHVGDYLGFIEHSSKLEPKHFSLIEEEIRRAEIKKGKKLDAYEQREIINNTLKSGHYSYIPRPGATKARTVSNVTPQMAQYYSSPIESVYSHVLESTESLGFREQALGETRRNKNVKRLRGIMASLNKKHDPALVEEWDKIANELEAIEAEEGIFLSDLIKDKVAPENQQEVIDLFRARMKQRGTYGVVNTTKNALYLALLASPTSALTQLGDMAFNVYDNNPVNAFTGAAKAFASLIKGDSYARKYFDFTHSTKDFPIGKFAEVLDKALALSGLKSLDIFGKEAYMRGTIDKWSKSSLEEFTAKWRDSLGDATEKTWRDLKDGNHKTEEVLFFLFNSLSNVQPISMSELPKGYLEAGNGRIFYMLKTFSLRALNKAYDDAQSEYKKGNKAKAALKVGSLLMLLAAGGAGTDELKDFLLGRETDFNDNVWDNLLQLIFLNKYALERGTARDQLVTSIMGGFAPPFRVADDMVADVYAMVAEDKKFKFKTLRNIPIVGRIGYAHIDPGTESYLKVNKSEIHRKLREGKKWHSLRKQIEAHNKRAREKGMSDMLITYSGAMRAVKSKK